MNTQKQIDRLITQRASEWFETLQSGKADRCEFARWVGESPRNMAEFMAILSLTEELPAAFERAGIDREALLKRISSNVTPLPDTSSAGLARASRKVFAWRRFAAAAAVLATTGLILWFGADRTNREFSTAVGEQRTVALADGSLMYLNAHSTAQVKFAPAGRDIRLIEGEAMFQVARDRQRPFRVHTRDAVVRAVGTRFNVDARPSGTVVSVLEGKVEVSGGDAMASITPAPLSAGEAAEISRAGKLQRHSRADVTTATAWRQRQLVFSRTALEDVAAQFNRFHRTGRMVLKNVAPGSHHYTGTFDADDVASFAAVLAREADLKIEQREGDYVIRDMPVGALTP